MPRPIHPIPTAGGIAPLSLSDIQSALSAASTNYATATRYAAIACDHSGALILPDGPIQPVCSLGSIAWPELGYDITIASDQAATDPGKLTATSRPSAKTIATSNYRGSSVSESRLFFISDTVASTNYFPRIQRRTALPKDLLAALPEASPRAGSLPVISGGQEYFSATLFEDVDYTLKATRTENGGHLLSFPLLGVQRVRLRIVYDFTYSGNRLNYDGAISIPLRACFVPVKADVRLTHWPSWPYALNFDAEYNAYYGSGLIPTNTLSLQQTLYALGTSQTFVAQWDLDIPPSGLGLFWVELDPFKYLTFAREMIHERYNLSIWQSLTYRARISQALALP